MSSLRKGEATSARMVESMLELIQSRGYAGTGINAVLEHAAAPKGSMYFHFPEGKEELGERAIGMACEQYRDLIVETAAGAMSPGRVVARIVDVLAALLVDSNYALGCPVSVVTLEMGGQSDRLRNACAGAYNSWIAAVSETLTGAGLAAERAHELAVTTVSAIEGAMILSRASRDTQPLTSAAHVLGELLDTLIDNKEKDA